MESHLDFNGKTKAERYRLICEQARALTEGIPHRIANLANLSALLMEALPEINWAGFYLLEGQTLVLGPFQGKTACIEIPVGKGVCGTAVAQDAPQLVPDVHAFPGHIACDSASNAEIVLPIHRGNQVVAVLDIDSPTVNRFTQEDLDGLLQMQPILEAVFRD